METKSRHLIIETLQPTLLKVHQQREDLQTLQRTLTSVTKHLKDLDYTVYQKDERLNVFTEIDERITRIEKLRAENEAALWWEVESLKKVNRDQHFENETRRRQVEALEAARGEAEAEMGRMKASWERSKEEFAKEQAREIAKMMDEIEEMRKYADKTSVELGMTTSKAIANYNYIREL